MTNRLIARWESRSGKWWAELYHDGTAATYKAVDAGGCLGCLTEHQAIKQMQQRADMGYFQPDAATTRMKRAVCVEGCPTCKEIQETGFGPSHYGSESCESGSLASGGKYAHCTCDTCF